MNSTVLNFLSTQNINLVEIEKFDGIRVDSKEDINNIICNNSFYKNTRVLKSVCIDNIKGYDYRFISADKHNFVMNMPLFFDENGSGYEKRSISMLQYSSNEIVDKLSNSFKSEPIHLLEADRGKYVIGDNGLHRFHVLKAHYLKELSLIDQSDISSIVALQKKYTIDAWVDEIDYLKTYAAFLLKKIGEINNDRIRLDNELDKDYNLTGNVVLKHYNYEKHEILNDKQFIKLLTSSISEILLSAPKKNRKEFLNTIKLSFDKFESFRDFCLQNLPEIIPYLDKNIKHYHEEEALC